MGRHPCLPRIWGPWAIQGGRGNDESGNFLINLWSAGVEDNAKRPIMVWIHGGGFSSGSGNMADYNDGIALAKQGVVIATINHRLDIMGFLDLSSYNGKWAMTENVGMLDIVEALKWIKDNADVFGGDPNNVTIFGESGGGGKVGTLMCMPAAKGLFHKAIIESGAKQNVMNSELSEKLGQMVVEELGLDANSFDQLNTIPYVTISKAGNKCVTVLMGPRRPGTIKMWGFVPTDNTESLPQQPYKPGFSNLSSDIPLIFGSTFNELDRTFYDRDDMSLEEATTILQSKYGDYTQDYIDCFKKTYPERSILDLVGLDCNNRAQSLAAADYQSANASAPVFVYLFNWYFPGPEGQAASSFHSLEIPFVFNNTDMESTIEPGDEKAHILADKMSAAWVGFAKTGTPSSLNLPTWEAYTAKNGASMIFDNTCIVEHNHDRELQDILTKCLK